jgi:hypothetical protein
MNISLASRMNFSACFHEKCQKDEERSFRDESEELLVAKAKDFQPLLSVLPEIAN